MLQCFHIDMTINIDGRDVPGRIYYLWDRALRTFEEIQVDELTPNGRRDVFEEYKASFTEEFNNRLTAKLVHMYPGGMWHGEKMRQMSAQ